MTKTSMHSLGGGGPPLNLEAMHVHVCVPMCACVCVFVPSMDGSICSKDACPSCEVSALRAAKNFIPPSFLSTTHFSRVSILSVSFRVESMMSSSSLEVSKSCSFSLGTRAVRSMHRTQAKRERRHIVIIIIVSHKLTQEGDKKGGEVQNRN